MKKTYKIIGISALLVALICNLQNSLFFSAENNPNAAKASFTWEGNLYCGDDNGTHTGFRVGTWMPINDPSSPYDGQYYFVPSNSGSQCGLVGEDGAPTYMGYDVTSVTPTMLP